MGRSTRIAAAGAVGVLLALTGVASSALAAPGYTAGSAATNPALPYGIAIDTGRDVAYVSGSGNNKLVTIDLATDTEIASVSVGSRPEGVAVDQTTGLIYVANNQSDNVSVVSAGGTSVVATIPVGSRPHGAAVDSARGLLYTANNNDGSVSVVDLASRTTTATITGMSSAFLPVVDEATGDVYVGTNGAGVFHISSGIATSVPALGGSVLGLAIDQSTRTLYAAGFGTGSVTSFDLATQTPSATQGVGAQPSTVAVDEARGVVYVGNSESDSVSVLSTGSLVPLAPAVTVGDMPYASVVDTVRNRALIANFFGNPAVSIIEASPYLRSTSVPAATVGSAYGYTFDVAGASPVAFTLTGALPPGITFDPATGALSGTPTSSGVYTFSVTVTNADGSDTRSFTATVAASTTVTSGTAGTAGTVGTAGTGARLPDTGADAAGIAWIAAPFLVAGLALLLVTRRRQAGQ